MNARNIGARSSVELVKHLLNYAASLFVVRVKVLTHTVPPLAHTGHREIRHENRPPDDGQLRIEKSSSLQLLCANQLAEKDRDLNGELVPFFRAQALLPGNRITTWFRTNVSPGGRVGETTGTHRRWTSNRITLTCRVSDM